MMTRGPQLSDERDVSRVRQHRDNLATPSSCLASSAFPIPCLDQDPCQQSSDRRLVLISSGAQVAVLACRSRSPSTTPFVVMTLEGKDETIRFLYAILRQFNPTEIDWEAVARDPILMQPISNGHAARMRYFRIRVALGKVLARRCSPDNSNNRVSKPKKNRSSGAQHRSTLTTPEGSPDIEDISPYVEVGSFADMGASPPDGFTSLDNPFGGLGSTGFDTASVGPSVGMSSFSMFAPVVELDSDEPQHIKSEPEAAQAMTGWSQQSWNGELFAPLSEPI
ncbi:hypothetical protein GQ602_006697 [Ophiocordyceps camponoti-floridani]|uniref:Myb-like DNA-binding domain-containing protein n=1 Tax=Ophiocordyceps camponoti-floridani TaxID=2030778 RepID=A0A8H4VAY9_9HYPO|nr:hypothetical protein GQ602_006697 [Ophiocordyceps camponoti-floridani]